MKLDMLMIPTDVIRVKQDIKTGLLKVVFHNGNILLKNTASGEAVKIGELPKEGEYWQRENLTLC